MSDMPVGKSPYVGWSIGQRQLITTTADEPSARLGRHE